MKFGKKLTPFWSNSKVYISISLPKVILNMIKLFAKKGDRNPSTNEIAQSSGDIFRDLYSFNSDNKKIINTSNSFF